MTIHFTLNYPVKGVAAQGSFFTWNTKYAVLIPVTDFIDRITCLNPVDTWVIGKLALPPSAEILMPEAEYYKNPKKWNSLAGKAKIVPYAKNYSIHEAIIIRIKKRGFTPVYGHDNAWFEGSDLEHIQRFIKQSKFLTWDEKDRLVALAVKKGYHYWGHIFQEIAGKFKKITTPHWKTLWREIENFSEELYILIFDPGIYSEETLSSLMHLVKLKYSMCRQYQKDVASVLKEETYTASEEKEALHHIILELQRIEKWLEGILTKIKASDSKMLWKDFLKNNKLID